MLKSLVLAAVAGLAAAPAFALSVNVPGTASIYNIPFAGSGYAVPSGSTQGSAYTFTAGAGQVLNMSSVTGLTNCCNGTPGTGADGGGNLAPTAVTAFNGISGINAPSTMFLAGVFLDLSSPPAAGSAPPSITYTDPNAAQSHAPLLNQAFFIGDGLTTGGAVQDFFVPDDATAIVFGFADASGFNGQPGLYGDNNGSLTANFSLGPTATVPLPAGLPLLALALAGLAAVRRPGARAARASS